MDFKSHEEVVLPPDEAAKKRAREAARKPQPALRVREIRIPAGKKPVKGTPADTDSGERAVPRVPIREVQLSASESNIGSAAASLTPEDMAESVAVESPAASLTRENAVQRRAASPVQENAVESGPAETDPVERREAGTPAVEPKILNAGLRLLTEASRQDTPGGRLVRSGRLAPRTEPVETEAPSGPAIEKRKKPTRTVKVESLEKMQFPKENVEEVATLQAPPPVEQPPEQPALEIESREAVEPAQPEPIEIDSMEFVDEMDIPESEPVELKSSRPAEPIGPPQPAPIEIDSKEFAESLDIPEAGPLEIDSKEPGGTLDFPGPDPLEFDSEDLAEEMVLTEKETETIEVDPRELASGADLPEPEPVVVVELGQADLVWEPPESASGGDPEKPARKARSKGRKTSTQKPYRDFIIAYDGVFIGHFRSKKRITNRTAFQQVARQLHSTMSSFDVRKLQLYRPVPIEIEIPESISGISDGAFMWFADRQRDA